MSAVSFQYLDKREKEGFLAPLFAIQYENMNQISPTGEGFEADFRVWRENVSPALEKAQRQIVLLYADGALAGFFMYYVNESVFMMEELQLKPAFWHTGLFSALYRWLLPRLPAETPLVEAYVLPENTHSREVLAHLGLSPVGGAGRHLHMRGSFSALLHHYTS